MRLIPSLLFVFSAFLSPVTASDVLMTEPFSKETSGEGVPFGWQSTHPDHVDIVKLAKKPYQRIWYQPKGGGSAAIYLTATIDGKISKGQLKDFSATSILRIGGTRPPSDSTLRGFILRAQSLDLAAPSNQPFWGYSVGVIASGERRGLYLFENPTGYTSQGYGTQLAFSPIPADLEVNPDYQLSVKAQGSVIFAVLQSPEGENLTRIEYREAMDVAGYFGIRAAHSNTNQNTYFRDLTIESL